MQDTLFLNQDIDVSRKGLAGAVAINVSSFGCNKTDYFYPAGSADGAPKGNGVATVSGTRSQGRGRMANGGGGGNEHNAGGAGGGNGGAGGRGGYQHPIGSCGTVIIPDIGGIGGQALGYSAAAGKIFMGGGGGAGHVNNGGTLNGGAGGGIILLDAPVVISVSKNIVASGDSAAVCAAGANSSCDDDAGGGGGAAGTVLLKVNTWVGNTQVLANGGIGAKVYLSNASGPKVGPGGGGGVIWTVNPLPANVTATVTGGQAGVLPQYANDTYGALPGAAGITIGGLSLPVSNVPFAAVPVSGSVAIVDSFLACRLVGFRAASIAYQSFVWSFDDNTALGAGSPVTHNYTQNGIYTVRLTATNTTTCRADTGSRTIVLNARAEVHATADTTVCYGDLFRLSARGAKTYRWEPSNLLTFPATATPNGVITKRASFEVTGVDSLGCVGSDTVHVGVFPRPVIHLTYSGQAVTCKQPATTLTASGGISYLWMPAAVVDDASGSSVTARPGSTTLFVVAGRDINGCTGRDSVIVPVDRESAVFVPTAFSPNGDAINDIVAVTPLCNFIFSRFRIFNRYGQMVFSSENAATGWNGVYGGTRAEAGVYYYYVEGLRDDNTTVVFKGDITLVR